jgi:hypothetical protein
MNELLCVINVLAIVFMFASTFVINIVYLENRSLAGINNSKIFNGTINNHYQANYDHYCVSTVYVDKEGNKINCLLTDDLIKSNLSEVKKNYPIDTEIMLRFSRDDEKICKMYLIKGTQRRIRIMDIFKNIRLVCIIIVLLYLIYGYYESSVKEKMENDTKYLKAITKELYNLKNTKYEGNKIKETKKNEYDISDVSDV